MSDRRFSHSESPVLVRDGAPAQQLYRSHPGYCIGQGKGR